MKAREAIQRYAPRGRATCVHRLELRRVRDESVTMPARVIAPDDAVAAIAEVLGADRPREAFVALYLDARMTPIGYEVLCEGAGAFVSVAPCELFRSALVAGASAVIVAHNHPSGDPTPSQDDIDLTRRLRAAGEIVGVTLLDHLVIAGRDFRSLAESLS